MLDHSLESNRVWNRSMITFTCNLGDNVLVLVMVVIKCVQSLYPNSLLSYSVAAANNESSPPIMLLRPIYRLNHNWKVVKLHHFATGKQHTIGHYVSAKCHIGSHIWRSLQTTFFSIYKLLAGKAKIHVKLIQRTRMFFYVFVGNMDWDSAGDIYVDCISSTTKMTKHWIESAIMTAMAREKVQVESNQNYTHLLYKGPHAGRICLLG